MSTKTVYSYDPVSRLYLRALTLDEGDMSPLEPGVWLIPGNCLEVAPPEAGPGKYVREEGGNWVLYDIPEAEIPATPPPPSPAEPHIPTMAEIARGLVTAVQGQLDAMARTYGYDDIKTAVTYADEPAVPKFWAEGRMLRAWRSLVWKRCYELQAEVVAGERPVPTPKTLFSLLPVPNLTKAQAEQAALEAEQAAVPHNEEDE